MQNRESNRNRKFRQITKDAIVDAELSLRWWRQHHNYYQFIPLVIQYNVPHDYLEAQEQTFIFFDFDSLLGVQALREVRTRVTRGEHSRSHCVIQYRRKKRAKSRVSSRRTKHTLQRKCPPARKPKQGLTQAA